MVWRTAISTVGRPFQPTVGMRTAVLADGRPGGPTRPFAGRLTATPTTRRSGRPAVGMAVRQSRLLGGVAIRQRMAVADICLDIGQPWEQYLRGTVNYHQDNWTKLLPLAEFAYINTIQGSTQ
jgi:hypothetical protein